MQIFISYSHKDKTFSQELYEMLLLWGYTPWLYQEGIQAGDIWTAKIDEALRESDVVLGVLTPDSVTSENVLSEWMWARLNGKPFIPLYLRDVPPSDFPHQFVLVQYIDFRQDKQAGYEDLKARLYNPATLYRTTTSENEHSASCVHINWPITLTDNRIRMLKKVFDFWVVGVLENVLIESKEFELGLEAVPGAVLRHRDYGDYVLPTSVGILQVFEDMNRELLILGEPGSGKTILMLQLACQLIAKAQQDERFPIPVIFNLSSWAADHQPLAEWLIRGIQTNYQVPKKVAQEWIKHEKLLLLLDGLDEVAASFRDDCIDAINRFRQECKSVRVVVCSRTKEYAALSHKLDVQGAVELKPLTEYQIQAYLADSRLTGLRETIKTDETLSEMTRTPFLLHCMGIAYSGKSEITLRLPVGADGKHERREHLFNSYIDCRLQQASETAKYAHKTTRSYLTWLAEKMVENGQSVFYIEGLQLEWLQKGNDPPAFLLVYGLFVTLVIGLFGCLVGGMISPLISGLVGGLEYGLLGGLISGLFLGPIIFPFVLIIIGTNLKHAETLVFNITQMRRGLVTGLVTWLSFEVFFVLFGELGVLVGQLVSQLVVGLVIGLVVMLVRGLIYGLELGLGFGLIVGLLIGLSGIEANESVGGRTRPNEGTRRSAQNALRVGVGVGLPFIPVGFLVGGIKQGLCPDVNCGFGYFRWTLGWPNLGVALLFGLLGALAVGLSYGGRQVILHYTIRYLLWRRGSIPAHYATFLDYAAERILLRKVGGGYIFIHRLLLEHYAGVEMEECEPRTSGDISVEPH